MKVREIPVATDSHALVRLSPDGEDRLADFYLHYGIDSLLEWQGEWRKFSLEQLLAIFGSPTPQPPFVDDEVRVVAFFQNPSDGQRFWSFHCSNCSQLVMVAQHPPKFDFFGVEPPEAFPVKRYFVTCPECRSRNYIFPHGSSLEAAVPEQPTPTRHLRPRASRRGDNPKVRSRRSRRAAPTSA